MPGTIAQEHIIPVEKWIAENTRTVRELLESQFSQTQIDNFIATQILPPLTNAERLQLLKDTLNGWRISRFAEDDPEMVALKNRIATLEGA